MLVSNVGSAKPLSRRKLVGDGNLFQNMRPANDDLMQLSLCAARRVAFAMRKGTFDGVRIP